jgi:hypothetical protein
LVMKSASHIASLQYFNGTLVAVKMRQVILQIV